MAKAENRRHAWMACTVCKNQTKRAERNIKNTTERLELSMYCPKCHKHTEHKEQK